MAGGRGYEFSDGSATFSGILRKPNGDPTVRLYSNSGADVPNRLTVELQDEYNEYQQDSLSLLDADDSLLTGREVTTAFQGIGLPNFDQASADAGAATGEVDLRECVRRVSDDDSRRRDFAWGSDHCDVPEGGASSGSRSG